MAILRLCWLGAQAHAVSEVRYMAMAWTLQSICWSKDLLASFKIVRGSTVPIVRKDEGISCLINVINYVIKAIKAIN